MPWWRRQPAESEVHWNPFQVAAGSPIFLDIPWLRGRPLVLERTGEVRGRTIEQRRPAGFRTETQVPPSTVLSCTIGSSLSPLLVLNDFFAKPDDWGSLPQVDIPLPPDNDAYDGKVWRVFAPNPEYAKAVLDDAFWADMDAAGATRTLVFLVAGRRIVTTAGKHAAEHLDMFASNLERRVASGVLDPWLAEGRPEDVAPPFLPGTDWHSVQPDRMLLFWLADIWPTLDYSATVRGTVDGHQFMALCTSPSVQPNTVIVRDETLGSPLPGVVLLPLEHPVPDHVHYASGAFNGSSTVHTEWIDFDDTFSVRSHDERVGHETTTPRLMQYLYDNRIRRLDVRDGWVLARIRSFDQQHITDMVRLLAGARDLLPGYDIDAPRH